METTTENDFFSAEDNIFLAENEFPFENPFPPFVPQETVVVKNEIPEEIPEEMPMEAMVEESAQEIPIPEEIPAEEENREEEELTTIEEQFTVEAIVGKRKRNARIEYNVKWLGFEDSENTWEPIDNLNCQELIAEFEAKETTRGRGRRATPKASPKTTTKASPKTTKGDGFSRGLKPKKVIGVCEERGQLFYSIEWAGEEEASLVASKIARIKCPQLVIQFLQSKLTFNRKRPREPLENYRPIASKSFSLFSEARE